MSNPSPLRDEGDRLLAETTFDRNVVVVAGAGTGKTTLLVNRLVNLIMKEPHPVPVTEIVALTFTNKAASEMKVRFREQLAALAKAGEGNAQRSTLRERYGISSDHIADRAKIAIRDMEKSQIGTLHSFAAHLLRLHPLESGVDPSFREDDGTRFEELFATEWLSWLDRELVTDSPRATHWRRILAELGLDDVRAFTKTCCSDLIPMSDLRTQLSRPMSTTVWRAWLTGKQERARWLLTRYDRPKRRKVETLLGIVERLFGLLLQHGLDGMTHANPDDRTALDKNLGKSPTDWDHTEFVEAATLIDQARQLFDVDHAFWLTLLDLVSPFVVRMRHLFFESGWVSFDGLLARARLLLHDHPSIRERLKHEYQAILIDEFQDTDPIQYEIVLYLAEQPGRCQRRWQDIAIHPGKLFIVGDPKQSIYAFRRADIEAFERVVKKILAGSGVQYALSTNFRSHEAVLSMVNPLFDRLLIPQSHVQPPNVPLTTRPDRRGGVSTPGLSLLITKADAGEEVWDATAATRAEADRLARWITEEWLGHAVLTDAAGHTTPVRPGHIAMLFRKLTHAQSYLDALRRHGIQYITDGEKHFYRRQEVVDLITLLRAIDNPHDAIALAGLLRSPLGGIPDRDLYELSQRDALSYRHRPNLATWRNERKDHVDRLYGRLADLHRSVCSLPLDDALDIVLNRLPVLELAAASLHGEQAVANLLKIQEIAASLSDRPSLTLSGFVQLMSQRVTEEPDEAESALAEESLEAVRVLTIHKAKGLEFPLVILPGLHQGSLTGSSLPAVSHDWSTNTYGLTIGRQRSLGAVLVGEKLRTRELAEQRRVLYVGMTRAKEALVLSGAITARTSRDSWLGLLAETVEGEIGAVETVSVRIGNATIPHHVSIVSDLPRRPTPPKPSSVEPAPRLLDITRIWQRREAAWKTARATARHLTPTGLPEIATQPNTMPHHRDSQRERSRWIGVVTHRLLEDWDYQQDSILLADRLRIACKNQIPPELELERPSLEAELQTLFATFIKSEAYRRLTQATILGREVPFTIPWEQGQVMSGVIDLIYRLDDKLWIADYKTDDVPIEGLSGRIDRYREQVGIYLKAVTTAMGQPVEGCHLIFVRQGIITTV